jgi:hypothetical protein
MKLQAFIQLVMISLASCTVLPLSILFQFNDQLSLIEVELEDAQPFFSTLIKLFFSFKSLYKHFESKFVKLNQEIKEFNNLKLESVLSRYHTLIISFYTSSPLESLRAVRLYSNFEFAYLFIRYIRRNYYCSLSDFEYPVRQILRGLNPKFRNRNANIFKEYAGSVKRIMKKSFKELELAQPCKDKVSKLATQNSSYNVDLDWEERREILREIILIIKSLNIFSRHLSTDVSDFFVKIKGKVEKYEFAVKNFQVDSQGPSLSHFLSIFYRLQRQFQNVKFYEDLPSNAKKLLFLFKIYWHHLIRNQLTDPQLFPKKILALVSHIDRGNRKIFEHLKPTIDLRKTVASLRKRQLFVIFNDETGDRISEICKIETNSQAEFDLGKGVWHNLLNYKDILAPGDEWLIKVYLALQSNE